MTNNLFVDGDFSVNNGKVKSLGDQGLWTRGLRVTGVNDLDAVLTASTTGIALNKNTQGTNIAATGVITADGAITTQANIAAMGNIVGSSVSAAGNLECGALGTNLTALVNGRARAVIRAVIGA